MKIRVASNRFWAVVYAKYSRTISRVAPNHSLQRTRRKRRAAEFGRWPDTCVRPLRGTGQILAELYRFGINLKVTGSPKEVPPEYWGGTRGQLQFHLGAAMNVGLTEAQIRDFISVLAAKVSERESGSAEEVLTAVLNSRK
jgi:hypothetical protein